MATASARLDDPRARGPAYGLDAICLAALKISGGEDAAQFARRLYERVADKDLATAPAEQRGAAAISLLAFARRRLPAIAKVRVFNPDLAHHGFESRHSIVQIVNDDMPFLVDSIAGEFNRREIAIPLLAHPVMAVRRDLDGDLGELASEAGEGAPRESLMHIEIDRQADPALLDELAAALTRVLAEVRMAVDDWRALGRACLDAIEDLTPGSSGEKGAPDLAENEEFLRWLEANHFTFLGHRRYRYVEDPAQSGGIRYEQVPGSALGILRRDEVRLFDEGLGGGQAMARFAKGPEKLLIVKTDRAALVHRSGAMDCVIVKTHDRDGRVTGERRLVGFFTSAAYHAMAQHVPLLRARVDGVVRRAGLDPDSHDGKALLAILESYPRDELFQIDADTLYDHALGILQLQERRQVALFTRRDAVGRFASCLVFAPRERFDAALSERFAALLEKAWHGEDRVGHRPDQRRAGAGPRPLFVAIEEQDGPAPDLAELERALADAATSWNDRLRSALEARLGKPKAAPPPANGAAISPRSIARYSRPIAPWATSSLLQAALGGKPFGVRLERDPGQPPHRFTLRLFHPKDPDRAVRHPAAGGEPRTARAERSAVPS